MAYQPAPYCRVLPPGQFNSMIPILLPMCHQTFISDSYNHFPIGCTVTGIITRRNKHCIKHLKRLETKNLPRQLSPGQNKYETCCIYFKQMHYINCKVCFRAYSGCIAMLQLQNSAYKLTFRDSVVAKNTIQTQNSNKCVVSMML